MNTATAASDAGDGVTLFARIPEPVNEDERIRKYDGPLSAKLAETGIDCSVRGFCIAATDDAEASVALELHADNASWCAVAGGFLAELGAPPSTVIEVESDKALITLTL